MFGLAPHPPLPRPSRGSPRMFKSDWVENYFSRVKWWHVLVIWVPVSLVSFALTLQKPGAALATAAALFALGLLAWTLLEYLLHRFVFHIEPDPKSEFQVDVMWLIHGVHHDYPSDPDRLVMPPFATLVVALLLWLPIRWAFGPLYNTAFFGGLVLGYVGYDQTHFWLHHAIPTTAAGKWMRKYHMVHHFSTPERRYGITSPLWDVVFGTFPRDRWAGLSDQSAAELEEKHGE
jgi:sterol desaturase/sphingolipid hydroxylase (fatty acid hydroxylase superfamily)